MGEVTSRNFGLLIAYLLPGFTVLCIARPFFEAVEAWFGETGESATVGGFLLLTLASVAVGLTVSTLRWLAIDTIHHHTGLSINGCAHLVVDLTSVDVRLEGVRDGAFLLSCDLYVLAFPSLRGPFGFPRGGSVAGRWRREVNPAFREQNPTGSCLALLPLPF